MPGVAVAGQDEDAKQGSQPREAIHISAAGRGVGRGTPLDLDGQHDLEACTRLSCSLWAMGASPCCGAGIRPSANTLRSPSLATPGPSLRTTPLPAPQPPRRSPRAGTASAFQGARAPPAPPCSACLRP
ncbi:Hypothetical predicted protein [Marmota monax]|uniref:Uncharacterized protein n=1 Tax=Marmota monax TaxID=9995 RepID=A0A5E4BVK9_MARMO|nr:hypothetical protein GHT09_003529 [Marmota monax]VTJ73668.1 Hypothetical predicted protein [Marmota monax]